MPEPVAEVTTSEPKVESVVNNVISSVRSGETRTLIESLWNDHQAEIIRLGKSVLIALVVILLAWLVTRVCKKFIQMSTKKLTMMDDSLRNIFISIAKTLIWVLAALIILDLFGVNTASILTVLGAAGLAVGLAMKDSLSNIAAGLMLLFMRPYKVGDYVDCGTVSGTITDIGLFSTTLKTVDGVFISAPNTSIFGNPIKNYSRNPYRRADITVGIAYGDSLPKALEVLNGLMAKNELIVSDPAPQVLVAELADSSVNLTLRYWSKTEDYWNAYWEIKQQLKEAIESNGLNIPFPQRVVTMVTPKELEKGE
ncbi:MAG: mechanosensitive ion channel family protein [Victivallales bacterium]|nr:mechanosensitive ion channel family protein [Victivallales bacterium]